MSHYLCVSVSVRKALPVKQEELVCIMPPEYPIMLETSVCEVVEDSHSYMSFCVLLQSATVSDGGEYSIAFSL